MRILSQDLEIDPSRQLVFRGNALIQMTPLTYQCLMTLIEAAPDIADTESLMATLWPDRVVNDETLTQRIALLRKDLGGDDREGYIQSIRSRGYRWRHPVETIDITPPGPRPGWQTALIVVACLTGCVLLASAWRDIVANRRAADESVITESRTNSDPYAQLIQQADRYAGRFTPEGTNIAIDQYRQALALNPSGLEAITGLSQALSQGVTKFNAPRQWLLEATTLAEAATTLAPENAHSWWTLGFTADAQGQIRTAIRHYRKALLLDPHNARYAGSLAYLLGQSGQLVEAMQMNLIARDGNTQYSYLQIAVTFDLLGWPVLAEQWFERADSLNPDSVFAGLGRAQFLFTQRRLDDASRVINRAIEAGVNRPESHCLKGQIALLENRPIDAASEFDRAIQIDPVTPCGPVWRYWLAQQSEDRPLPEPLETLLRETIPDEEMWPTQFVHAAMIRMAQDRPSAALQLLEAGVRAGFRQGDLLLQSVAFRPLRDEPDFNALIEAIREDVSEQRQQLLQADWLPERFLEPARRQGVLD